MRIDASTLAAALLAAAATAETVAPYASPAEIGGDPAGVAPGSLHWHRDGSGAPFLSVGTLSGGREEVRDRAALHRATYFEIAPPDYSVELGEGVSVSNGWFVLFDRRQDDSETVTRSVTLTPSPEYRIVSVRVRDARGTPARVEVSPGGSATVSCTTMQPAPGMPTYTDCAFDIELVMAAGAAAAEARDDLTRGDYLFTDPIGDTSLGGIRPWVRSQIDGRLAEDWSRYPARAPVDFADQPVRFDRLGRFRTALADGAHALDTLRFYAGGRPALEIAAETSSTNNAFRIVAYAIDGGTNHVFDVVALGTNATVVSGSLSEAPSGWTEADGVRVDYAVRDVGGIGCYRITCPVEGNGRFFRAVTRISEFSDARIRANVPVEALEGVILVAPGGGRWRLKVADGGTLSTEAFQ